MGYRQLTRHSRRKYNVQVTRDTVMKFLCIIDSEGVECRKRRRLKRQRYITPGPNFLWHVDGWDKLAHIFIHGAVDGFSRQILWLEANSTNKNPGMIASHYRKSEVGSWKSEVGSQKSEVGSRKSEVGYRKSEVGSWKSEVGSPFSAFVVFSRIKGNAHLQFIEKGWNR